MSLAQLAWIERIMIQASYSQLMHSLVVKETAEATTQTDVVPEPEVAKPEEESKTEELKTGFNAGRFCRTIFFSGLAIVTLLAFFTFFGGVEFHGQVPEQPQNEE